MAEEEFLPINVYNTLIEVRGTVSLYNILKTYSRSILARPFSLPEPPCRYLYLVTWEKRKSIVESEERFQIEIEGFVNRFLYPSLNSLLISLEMVKAKAEGASYSRLFNATVEVVTYLRDVLEGTTKLMDKLTMRSKGIRSLKEAMEMYDEVELISVCKFYLEDTKTCKDIMDTIIDDMQIVLGKVRDTGELTARLVLDEVTLMKEEERRRIV